MYVCNMLVCTTRITWISMIMASTTLRLTQLIASTPLVCCKCKAKIH